MISEVDGSKGRCHVLSEFAEGHPLKIAIHMEVRQTNPGLHEYSRRYDQICASQEYYGLWIASGSILGRLFLCNVVLSIP